MATGEMCSMNETLKGEGNMSTPKKENMFHSMFNALNVMWEQFSRVSSSFLTGINSSLSVTVVHNEGIISPEIFENFTPKKEMLNIDNVYIHNAPLKESLNIIEKIPHKIFDKKPYMGGIFNEARKDNLKFSYAYVDNGNDNVNRSDNKKSIDTKNVKNNTVNCNFLLPVEKSYKESSKSLEYIYSDTSTHETSIVKDIDNYEDSSDKITLNKDHVSKHIDDSMSDIIILPKEPILSTSDSNIVNVQPSEQTIATNMLRNVWQKVCDSVTDRFCRTNSVESDVTMKRPLLSPKQQRKHNTIAKGRGRGRGRAKSQLRRSGVSQTRHRKERTKHELATDIQSDFRNWQESEMYDMIENKELEDCFCLDEDMVDGEIVRPILYTVADVVSEVKKPEMRNIIDQGLPKFSTRMRCISECMEESNIFREDRIENQYNTQRNAFRPRLMSESSIDSEDSYCIVFDNGCETAYRSGLEDTDESDTDEDTCNDEESVSSIRKVINSLQFRTVNFDSIILDRKIFFYR